VADKARVLIITTDKALVDEMRPSLEGRDFEPFVVPTVRDAAVKLGTEEFAGCVLDQGRVPAADREALLKIHKGRPFPFFLLETHQSISPAEDVPLRRLAWPLPTWFADQIRAVDKPLVFLVDKTLFASSAAADALRLSGIQPVVLESPVGLIDLLQKRMEAIMSPPPAVKPKTFWGKLSGSEPAAEEDNSAALGKVVVAFFPGTLSEAEAMDARVRQAVPSAVCYYLAGIDRLRAAQMAIHEGFPASLMREEAGRIAGIIGGGSEEAKERPKEKERILLLDNHKPTMEALGQALIAAGYEVVTTLDGGEALKLASHKGSFHIAVVGTALVYAQLAGAELAQKLRERDPDLRIIFMVDQYPLQAALKGVSQVVELGLDDALLKPVEASRLIFSVQRALERRFLLLENARLLEEVQESNRQLGQINSFQKKFFAMVAHDVKNPLTAILGYSEVLGMRLKEATDVRCATYIRSAAQTLNVLISDLVDLAAIESGKLRVEIGALDLAAVVQDVRARVDVVAQQRKINFAAEIPPVLPSLSGDPARLGQVIQNLCTNAIQYTKEGGSVTIRVDVTPDWVTVGVRDTGIGISKEDLPRVFERFFQTAEAQQMRKAGFGLGLKIAREIVQMHGGDIGLESELGVGSLFYFTLPVKK
jgi:signal transduction histidine kinase